MYGFQCIRIYSLFVKIDCDNAAGVSSHNVWDNGHFHVTASSAVDDVNSPQSARLSPVGRAGTGWVPKFFDENQWIQVGINQVDISIDFIPCSTSQLLNFCIFQIGKQAMLCCQ